MMLKSLLKWLYRVVLKNMTQGLKKLMCENLRIERQSKPYDILLHINKKKDNKKNYSQLTLTKARGTTTMSEYFLPMSNSMYEAHSGELLVIAIIATLCLLIVTGLSFFNNNNPSKSLIKTSQISTFVSMLVLMGALVLYIPASWLVNNTMLQNSSTLETQIIQNNSDVKSIYFKTGGNPAPDISPNSLPERFSHVFTCYPNSGENSYEGYVIKTDGKKHPTTITRTVIDENESKCLYDVNIAEEPIKELPVKNSDERKLSY